MGRRPGSHAPSRPFPGFDARRCRPGGRAPASGCSRPRTRRRRSGCQANDIVLRVGGHPVDSAAWEESAAPSAGTSAVPGPGFLVSGAPFRVSAGPIAAVLGAASPTSSWPYATPVGAMRLAVMLANQQTLVDPGGAFSSCRPPTSTPISGSSAPTRCRASARWRSLRRRSIVGGPRSRRDGDRRAPRQRASTWRSASTWRRGAGAPRHGRSGRVARTARRGTTLVEATRVYASARRSSSAPRRSSCRRSRTSPSSSKG